MGWGFNNGQHTPAGVDEAEQKGGRKGTLEVPAREDQGVEAWDAGRT